MPAQQPDADRDSERDVVVKSFDAPKGMLPIFSGATILGDGKPALILDAAGLT